MAAHAKAGEKLPKARVPRLLAFLCRLLLGSLVGLIKLSVLGYCCLRAYRIRLHAINTYGYVIHEFDPWFNFRATQYLADNGWRAFFQWYDYMSWYPIGRPVGTTIYPGMQIVAVALWRAFRQIPKLEMRLPDAALKMLPVGFAEYLPGHGLIRTGMLQHAAQSFSLCASLRSGKKS